MDHKKLLRMAAINSLGECMARSRTERRFAQKQFQLLLLQLVMTSPFANYLIRCATVLGPHPLFVSIQCSHDHRFLSHGHVSRKLAIDSDRLLWKLKTLIESCTRLILKDVKTSASRDLLNAALFMCLCAILFELCAAILRFLSFPGSFFKHRVSCLHVRKITVNSTVTYIFPALFSVLFPF